MSRTSSRELSNFPVNSGAKRRHCPSQRGSACSGGRGLRLDFTSALKPKTRWPYNSVQTTLTPELGTTHGSLEPAVSPPSAPVLTPSRLSVLPSEDEDEARCQRIVGTGPPRGQHRSPHPLRGPPGLAGETVFCCSHLELEYLGCASFLYKRMGLWHFRSLHSTWKLWNHRTFVWLSFGQKKQRGSVCFRCLLSPMGGLTVR